MARVLVIDDDPLVRRTIALILEAAAFEVTAVENGVAGRKAIEAARFDVAVIDIFMPEMDGIEMIRLARQRCPDMPIVAVSGAQIRAADRGMSQFPDYLSMATKLGAITAVQKPFQPRELVAAVRRSLGKAA
jgi:CheY-like chemotaxis protein